MTTASANYPIKAVNDYLNACCYRPDSEKLGELLDENVKLVHITNSGPLEPVKGKKAVLEAYNRNLFSNTTDIQVHELVITKFLTPRMIKMQLQVEETKENYDGITGKSRWFFTDDTTFVFTDKVLISKITTTATAALLHK